MSISLEAKVDLMLALLQEQSTKLNTFTKKYGLISETPKWVTCGELAEITNTKSDDNRSYHVSSEKIREVLGFKTQYTVQNAVSDLKEAFEKNILTNTFENELFFNIKRMNSINLK